MIQRLVLVLVVVLTGFLGSQQRGESQSAALLPNLIALPPSDLRYDRLRDGTHILRFSNTAWNGGEGRLELQGNPNQQNTAARQIYQNLYDQPVGGNRVDRRVASEDVVFHEGHQHFHFTDFADYFLLQKQGGSYVATQKKGIKTSFCIMDTTRIRGNNPAQYTSCGMELQGMTVGWGDTYGYQLADQWIVLGNNRLPAGTYAIQSVVNPKAKILESTNADNVGMTCFTVNAKNKIQVISC